MRSLPIVAVLASLGYVTSIPVEENAKYIVGAPAIDKRASLSMPSIRTTNVPMSPPQSSRTTTSSTVAVGTPITQSTTARPTTTTVRTTTTTRTTTRSTTAGPRPTQTINVTGMTYINAMLIAHNIHRPNHTESNLAWDATLATYAQQLAQTCVYGHSRAQGDGNYGQNIGAGAAGNAAAGLINNLMYNGEINNYPQPYGVDNADMSNFGSWGHYSQIVWSDTTSVGCATQYCPGGLANSGSGIPPYFTVCNYKPAGNFVGQFSKVKAPQGGNSYVVVGS